MLKTCGYFALLSVLLTVGCSFGRELHLGSLLTGSRHHEAAEFLEKELAAGTELSGYELFALCEAYLQIRRYDKLASSADMMEEAITGRGVTYYGEDMAVFPPMYRANAHLHLGDYQRSLEEASRGYALLLQENRDKQFMLHRYQLISLLGTLGVAHAVLGHAQDASECAASLKQVDVRMSNLGPQKQAAIAGIHMAGRDFPKALAEIRHPDAQVDLGLALFHDTTFQEMPRIFILAKSLYETGRVGEARKRYDGLLKHPRTREMGGIYWLVLFDRARIARADGESDDALRLLRQAVDVVEQQRSSINTETGKIGFVGDKQEIYQELVSLLLFEGRDQEAFEYVERSKARALVDLLASQREIPSRAGSANRVNAIITELNEVEARLSAASSADSKQWYSQQRAISTRLREDLAEEDPEIASLVTVTGVSGHEIRSLLSPDEALIEYYYSDREAFVFVVTQQDIRARRLERAGLRDSVEQFRQAVVDHGSSRYRTIGEKLYEQLFEPVSDLIQHERLIVVGHGVLHYVPFNALSSSGQCVIDRYCIRVLPSASVLKFLQAREAGKDDRTLVLGNPDLQDRQLELRFAEDEARSIAGMMQGSSVLLGSQATETFVKEHGAEFAVLHFAAHATFDLQSPLGSALLLAGDHENDGFLRVSELYKLPLDADLVTLSACETALGKVANGDDVVGFTRGLMYAGAGSVVSSLWKIDDRATRDLMVEFYKNLRKTDKQEALRQAQLTIKKRYEHPYYWAAFQLSGNSK